MKRAIRYLSIATVFVFLPATARADGSPAQTPAQTLAAVDQFFLTSYGNAAREILADEPPAFLVLDRLVLYRRGVRQEWPLLPPVFNELKTIAHVTLGLFAVLSPTNGAPLSADDAVALRRYQELIGSARSAIQGSNLTADQRQRQEQILSASQALAARALADGHMSAGDLTAFCHSVRPLVDANTTEAVHAYLDQLNRSMTAALPLLDAGERDAYLVIVTGVHQARIDNAAMQYFNRLLRDPPKIQQRLMYAENVSDEAGALRLLGLHGVDRRVGKAYFDDPYYMNRDLFAPAAAAYIPTLTLP